MIRVLGLVGLVMLGLVVVVGVATLVEWLVADVERRAQVRRVMEGREPAPWEDADWQRLVKVLRGPAFYDYTEDPARPFEERIS